MSNRKDAVCVAVASLLASCGFAMAGTNDKTQILSLRPQMVTADDQAAPRAPLMMGLDKIGAAKPLDDLGINIYGWVEAGYTYNHKKHNSTASNPILPGPFNHEVGNHLMLNQVDLRFERNVDSKKWDVGGMVEFLYGTDSNAIHSNGLAYGNESFTGKGGAIDADDRYNPQYQFDIPQAFIDVNVPVGNGLKIRTGKFVALVGYETIDPRTNPFYSHSWLFSMLPFTHTGIIGFYQINDQWSAALGISRGWDQALEDNNGTIDALGQVAWTPNKQWSVTLNWISGPENNQDNSHYRTVIDPIVSYQATDKLKLAVEGVYVYDGGLNAEEAASGTHAYGDSWGAAIYGAYTIDEYLTANVRMEKAHFYNDNGVFGDASDALGTDPNVPTINVYSITLGVTITPFPKDPIGQNLMVRPEVRYDWSEDHVMLTSPTHANQDQLTFAADVIFKF